MNLQQDTVLPPRQMKIGSVTREEALSWGKDARKSVPRSVHAGWEAAKDRQSPVAILAEQAVSREPDLVPIRHGRMMVSPFTFYRGAAAVMAADLATTPASGIEVQLCGDAHLLNFGGYASPERDLVFDVNDFDETLPGPWEWDVKRLAASLVVAGREAGFSTEQRKSTVAAAVHQYGETMRSLAERTELDVWYAKLDEALVMEQVRAEFGRKTPPNLKRTLGKARSKDHLKAFSKLTTIVDGQPRIMADPPLVVPIRDLVGQIDPRDLEEELNGVFGTYRETLQHDRWHLVERYRVVDMARKVVGVGSVGTRCWILLLTGRDNGDPLFLQVKEAQASVLAPFAGESAFDNQGERVVAGQRLMQTTSDIFLGWLRTTGLDQQQRDFYVRQLWDWKVSADTSNVSPVTITAYGRMCGGILAKAHARSGGRVAISAYLGSSKEFERAIARFGEGYADQNELDHQEFVEAVRDGVLPAEEGL
jgi:uncharacterized protein (DUF2252 family)